MNTPFNPLALIKNKKQFEYVNIIDDLSGIVQMPVGVVNGVNDGPTILITGGLYGTEYCGIEAASRLYREVDCCQLSGRLLVIPVVNMPCFQFNTPWLGIKNSLTPIDGLTLNRCFPGDHEGSVTQRIAAYLFQNYVLKSDYHIDFRGGDLHESHVDHMIFSVTGNPIDETCETMAKVFGMRYVLPRPCNHIDGILLNQAVKHGIPSIISESGLGYRTQPLEKFIALHINGTLNVMKYLKMLPGEPVKPDSQEYIYDGVKITAPKSGVFHAFLDQGEFVKKGDVIGKITDLSAATLVEIISPIDGVVHEMMPKRLVQKGDRLYSLCTVGKNTGWV